MSYNNPPQITQEPSVPVKLPLAPILSTPLNATLSNNRRGSSIFSPTQTPPPPQNDVVPAPAPDPNPAPSNNTPTPPNLRITVTPSPSSLNKLAAASVTNTSVTIRYKECLKNHAASMGAHVVDGCGEFMPSGEDGTPEAMKCAACDCHRNFHRKEIEGEAPQSSRYYPYDNNVPNSSRGNNNNNNNNNNNCSRGKLFRNQMTNSVAAHGNAMTTRMVNFGNAGDRSSSEDHNMFDRGGGHVAAMQPGSKKRFRSKFSQEQKDRMHDFAVKLGWRMQKQDEQDVLQFCNEVGVKRQVFKVWMHNNKQAMKKRQS